MQIEVGKVLEFYGKIDSINHGSDFANVNAILSDKTRVNVKIHINDVPFFQLNKVFHFETVVKENNDKLGLFLVKAETVYTYAKNNQELEDVLHQFYEYAPVDMRQVEKTIKHYLKQIEHPIIKQITEWVFSPLEREFMVYPAATKFHHAYIGGLAYHTATMLEAVEPFLKIYPYLSKDLLYASTILHDVCKVLELSGAEGAEYTKEGLMIGHLVMGAIMIDRAAVALNVEDHEAVMLLKHVMIAHHGQLNYGSPKKPMLPEALLLWYIDSIDSKLAVIGEEYEKTPYGEFTQPIGVVDKGRFYKFDLDQDK